MTPRYLRYFWIVAPAPVLAVGLFFWLFQVAKPFGASTTLAQLAAQQFERPELVVLPPKLNYNAEFKLEAAKLQNPDIMWFSTSRAGTATGEMFEPHRFYNMSFTAWTTEQLAEIFERATKATRPKLAILSLDYFLFTEKWRVINAPSRDMIFNSPFRYAKSSVSDFLSTAMRHRPVFEAYASSPTQFVGTQSILNQEGFRGDGSYVFSPGHIESTKRTSRTARFLIDAMPGAPNMSQRQMAYIEQIAEIAKERGIKVVAVQLPYLRAGIEFLDHHEGYRYFAGVWRDFESDKTRAWLSKLGIPLYDLARSSIDDDPDNFIDAYHLAEPGMRATITELMRDPAFQADLPSQANATASHKSAGKQ